MKFVIQQRSSMEKLCRICNISITSKDTNKFVSCSRCCLCFHTGCAGVTNRFYDYFIGQRGKPWYCHVCNTEIRNQRHNNNGANTKFHESSRTSIDTSSNESPDHIATKLEGASQLNIKINKSNEHAETDFKVQPGCNSEVSDNSKILVSSHKKTCSFIYDVSNAISNAANYCIAGCFRNQHKDHST